jgi:hypothetical protein
MLYVACGACRNANPLYCTGGFPMHLPMLAFQGPMGAQCPFCGPMLPWFQCGYCGLRQMMFFPSLPPLFSQQLMSGQMQPLAPVVQAPAGVDGNHLNSLFSKSVSGFVTSAASQFGKDFAGAMSGWIQDSIQGGFQDGSPSGW